jgi:hypothetical protein
MVEKIEELKNKAIEIVKSMKTSENMTTGKSNLNITLEVAQNMVDLTIALASVEIK